MTQRELTLGFSGGSGEAVRRAGAFGNSLFAALVVSCLLAMPALCSAEEDSTPSIFGYALSGFGTGAATGLAAGYLATGPKWESDEWKTVLWGGGIGALSGIGVGVLMGVIDAGTAPGGRGIGFYVMRDSNYGFTVGALAGGVVGVLYWAGGGSSKDLLLGVCWGTVIGAGSGVILGIVEGALRSRETAHAAPTAQRLHLDLGFLPSEKGVPLPYPNLTGRF
jgi:hypothetical protein